MDPHGVSHVFGYKLSTFFLVLYCCISSLCSATNFQLPTLYFPIVRHHTLVVRRDPVEKSSRQSVLNVVR